MSNTTPIIWMDYETWRAQQAYYDSYPLPVLGSTWDKAAGKWVPPAPPPSKVTESYNTVL